MVFSSSTTRAPKGTAPEEAQISKWRGRWSGSRLPPPGTPLAFKNSQPQLLLRTYLLDGCSLGFSPAVVLFHFFIIFDFPLAALPLSLTEFMTPKEPS